MSRSPRVSIISPAYQHERYVAQAIQSALDQTFGDFELIITDDGSTDQTVAVIQQFTDPRIRLFRFETNRGAAAASEHCYLQTRGEYIAFLSTDDLYHPEKLAKQVAFLDNHPETGAVFTHAHLIDETGQDYPHSQAHFRRKNQSRYGWLRDFFHGYNPLCASSAMIRRAHAGEFGRREKHYAQVEDLVVWIRLCQQVDIHMIEEPLTLLRLRRYGGNASAPRADTRIRTAWEFSRILRNYCYVDSIDTLQAIFPEWASWDYPADVRLMPFYVALLALRINKPGHAAFAMETLHGLFEDPAMEALLAEQCRFTRQDLFRLTGEVDVFQIEKARAWDLVSGSKSWRRLARLHGVLATLFPRDRVVRAMRIPPTPRDVVSSLS